MLSFESHEAEVQPYTPGVKIFSGGSVGYRCKKKKYILV